MTIEKFKVIPLPNGHYKVIKLISSFDERNAVINDTTETVFEGPISDCYAFIKLSKMGVM